MNQFKSIAITHKSFDISDIGKFHIEQEQLGNRLSEIKTQLGIEELMFLSTCNRVEFLFNTFHSADKDFVTQFISSIYPQMDKMEVNKVISSALILNEIAALKHIFQVASSLDSLVVGEREIITQVRNAYELCNKLGLTGDLIRLVVKQTIACAKEVYTQTDIANKPVSVVSLAYRRLKDSHVKPDAKFLIIGAGATSSTMGKYLKKHGLTNFAIFNRTLSKAQELAEELGGKAYKLEELKNYRDGFDVLVTCTGAAHPVITKELYSSLVGNDKSKKLIVDLAVPNDVHKDVPKQFDVHLIDVSVLKTIAVSNLREREKAMSACEAIVEHNINEFKSLYKERQVELAMSDVPKKVKEIYQTALNEVFVEDIKKMDSESKEVLDKVIAYLEKKYISVPMKMAKEILLDQSSTK